MPSCCFLRTLPASLVLVLGVVANGGGVARAAGDGERSSAPAKDPGIESIRAAVARALPLLVKAGAEEYPKHRDCFSCHNQAVPALALGLARRHGFAVEAETLRARSPSTPRPTWARRSTITGRARDSRGASSGPDMPYWHSKPRTGNRTRRRPPWHTTCIGPGSAQPLAGTIPEAPIRVERLHRHGAGAAGPERLRAEGRSTTNNDKDSKPTVDPTTPEAQRRDEALKWLLQTRPRETEDRVFRLWGLKHAGADSQGSRSRGRRPDPHSAARRGLEPARRPGGGRTVQEPGGPGPW